MNRNQDHKLDANSIQGIFHQKRWSDYELSCNTVVLSLLL